MTTLREDIYRRLGLPVPRDGWQSAFAELDRNGQLTTRVLIDLFVILAEHIEAYEHQSR